MPPRQASRVQVEVYFRDESCGMMLHSCLDLEDWKKVVPKLEIDPGSTQLPSSLSS